jgi:hypothetical protein
VDSYVARVTALLGAVKLVVKRVNNCRPISFWVTPVLDDYQDVCEANDLLLSCGSGVSRPVDISRCFCLEGSEIGQHSRHQDT